MKKNVFLIVPLLLMSVIFFASKKASGVTNYNYLSVDSTWANASVSVEENIGTQYQSKNVTITEGSKFSLHVSCPSNKGYMTSSMIKFKNETKNVTVTFPQSCIQSPYCDISGVYEERYPDQRIVKTPFKGKLMFDPYGFGVKINIYFEVTVGNTKNRIYLVAKYLPRDAVKWAVASPTPTGSCFR